MLLEALAELAKAIEKFDTNDTQRLESENQCRMEEQDAKMRLQTAILEKQNDDAQRKHDTTMTVINGVFGLLNAVMTTPSQNTNEKEQ